MSDWTWESPQTWVALTLAVLGPISWIVVTLIKSRPIPCRHYWEKVGENRTMTRGQDNSTRMIWVEVRCTECGSIGHQTIFDADRYYNRT